LAESLTDGFTELRGHPAHAARGPRQTKHDHHDLSDAEILDSGWHSDAQAADISGPEESCNEDAEAEALESDDPDLAVARGKALSAKLAAEVLSSFDSSFQT
jgi:hypothetical protein